ncbi:MAG: cysteine desulfurase [Chloroflexi bacterium RBG_13_60_13]|nr:MAG: cysteine desulfurase [Chloroflexi bacterium RBG_13_60_13]
MIYLDNAATSWPKPESVYQTMDSFLREKGANPGRSGYGMAVAAEQVIEETRTLVARLFGADDEKDVVFTLNCTDSLNLALKGLLRPGDHLVTDSIGHNSLVRPLTRLERDGVLVTRVPPSSDSGSISPADVEAAIRPTTRLIAVTHASNVSGVIQPIDQIGEVARKHRLVFLVDAAQSACVVPIDIKESNIDLLALSGHKGPLGPPGTGVLYVSKRVELEPLKEGGTGTVSESEEQPLDRPSRYESGTPNTVGIAGLGAGLKYVLAESVEAIGRHELDLAVRLLEGLAANPGVTVFGPSATVDRVGVVSFRIDGWSPGEVGAVLDQAFDIKLRTGLHCAPAAHKTLGTFPQGTVRASVGCFNALDDIDALLDAVGRIARAEPAATAATGVPEAR